jgi:hypothetical protein
MEDEYEKIDNDKLIKYANFLILIADIEFDEIEYDLAIMAREILEQRSADSWDIFPENMGK